MRRLCDAVCRLLRIYVSMQHHVHLLPCRIEPAWYSEHREGSLHTRRPWGEVAERRRDLDGLRVEFGPQHEWKKAHSLQVGFRKVAYVSLARHRLDDARAGPRKLCALRLIQGLLGLDDEVIRGFCGRVIQSHRRENRFRRRGVNSDSVDNDACHCNSLRTVPIPRKADQARTCLRADCVPDGHGNAGGGTGTG